MKGKLLRDALRLLKRRHEGRPPATWTEGTELTRVPDRFLIGREK